MEVRPGYKQTEVGVIPEDWTSTTIGDVVSFSGGSQPPRSTFRFTPTRDYIRLIQIRDYKSDAFETYIPTALARKRCTSDDVMIGRYGPPVFQILRGIDGAYNVALIKTYPSDRIDRDYMFYVLKQDKLFQMIDAMSRRSSGQTGVEMPALKGYGLPLPSLPEQRAIATALSDVDALLTKLDQFIVKKRDLKQAAMQQLLTGQTRLPGFGGEWEVKQLKDVFSISAGKSKSAYVVDGGRYWVVDMGSVSTDGRLIVSKTTNFFGDFLNRGDLVMPKDDIGGGGIIGKVGHIDADETYVLGDHVYRLEASRGNPLFLSYVINSYRTNSQLRKKVIGTAQLGLGRKSVDEQEVPFPKHAEQTAIAAVLSDMDAELAALEARRDKTRALKQGMMQELLTGRIRLV